MKAGEATKAFSDLHVFGALIAIVEGGTLNGEHSERVGQQIVEICKAEQQRLLREFDDGVRDGR